MLSKEQTEILEQAIFLLFRLRDEQSQENWELNRAREFERATQLKTKKINSGAPTSAPCKENEVGILIFTDKEIAKMPTHFRKIFRTHGCKAHVRKRSEGRYKCSYEIRYSKKPYNKHPISASATTLGEAKTKFIEKLNKYISLDDNIPAVPKTFNEFSLYWFENFHRRKVSEKTYKKNLSTYNRDIQKFFGHARLSDILPANIQNFLEQYDDRERTKETLHSLLNQIFKCAVNHGLLKLNPLDMCFYLKHEREHGEAFSKSEEKQLLTAYAKTPFELGFAIALYTGLRPNEYRKAQIREKFIVVQNSKRKNGKIEYKKIPINPMLRPYLSGVEELKLFCPSTYAKRLKSVLPNHTLYDMRTTFQTRCTEYGVAEVAIGLFMGNGIGGELKKAYTDVSEEWLIKEAEKFRY